jgi:hypothetical protein
MKWGNTIANGGIPTFTTGKYMMQFHPKAALLQRMPTLQGCHI